MGKRKVKLLYQKDLFDDWDDINFEDIEAKMVDPRLWGQLYSLVLDIYEYGEAPDLRLSLLESVIEQLKTSDIDFSVISDFISLISDEVAFLSEIFLVNDGYYKRELELIIELVGIFKIRQEVPFLKQIAHEQYFYGLHSSEVGHSKFYSNYRIEALEALFSIGAEEFLDVYIEALHDINSAVVSTAVKILCRLVDNLEARKALQVFVYYDIGFWINLGGLDVETFSKLKSDLFASNSKVKIEPVIFSDEDTFLDCYLDDVVFTLKEVIETNSFDNYSQQFLDLTLMYQSYDGIGRLGAILIEKLNNMEKMKQFIDFALNYSKTNSQIKEKIAHLKKKYLAN